MEQVIKVSKQELNNALNVAMSEETSMYGRMYLALDDSELLIDESLEDDYILI